MKFSCEVMVGEIPWLCVVAALAVGSAADGACERGRSWWAREQGVCLPCTRCEPTQAVRYPCELHRDTICQPLHDVHIYTFDTINSSDSESIDNNEEYYEDYDDTVNSDDENVDNKWDVQLTTLVLAASGCVVFFVVVIYFSFNHVKQWRVLKQALRSDVQDLSAKLKLMEAGESPAEPVVSTDHHIYCNIHVTKHATLGPPSKKKGPGNVYTQNKQ